MVIIAITCLFILYVILVTWRPPAILAALMSFYAFEQWAQVNSTFFAANPRFMNYMLAALVVYSVCVTTLRFGPPVRNIPIVAWMILALILLSGASYLWSINPVATREVTFGYLPYIVLSVIFLPMVIRNIEDMRIGLSTFLFVGTPIALMLLGSEIFGLTGRSLAFSQVVEDRYGRPLEAGNALAIGTFGGVLVICAAFLSWPGMSRWVGVARWLIVAIGLALVARSQSRGQMAAAVGVTAMLVALPAILGWRPKNIAIAIVGAVVLTTALPWALTFSLQEDRFDVREWAQAFSETRIQFCADLLQYWLDQGRAVHWLFGLGSGAAWHVIEVYPHVIPVEILVELGMFGLVIYVAFMLWLAFIGIKLVFQLRKNVDTQSVLMVVLGIWMFETILTLKQGTFLGSVQWMAFCILLAKFNIFVKQTRRSQVIKARQHAWLQLVARQSATPAPSAM